MNRGTHHGCIFNECCLTTAWSTADGRMGKHYRNCRRWGVTIQCARQYTEPWACPKFAPSLDEPEKSRLPSLDLSSPQLIPSVNQPSICGDSTPCTRNYTCRVSDIIMVRWRKEAKRILDIPKQSAYPANDSDFRIWELRPIPYFRVKHTCIANANHVLPNRLYHHPGYVNAGDYRISRFGKLSSFPPTQ